MKHIEVTDELLYKYMPIVDDATIREIESRVDTTWEFSSKFELKMKRLIKKEAHPWIMIMQNILKKVAIIFIAIISIGFIFTMSVEAYRLKFFETIRTIYEDSILYSYVLEDETGRFKNTEPTYIPEGYIEVRRIENAISTIIIYENNIGEQIIWEQQLTDNGSKIFIDSEYDTEEVRQIDGLPATIYSYMDGYALAYYEYGEYVYLITADRLDNEELFQLIDSMRN